MSKKRKSEGLFEAISKATDDQHSSFMRVPDWVYKKPEQAADEKQIEPPIPPKTKPPKTKVPAKPDKTFRPIISVDKDNKQITVAMNFVSWSVVALAVLVVLIGAFTLGRISAPESTVPGPTEPYRPDVLEPPAESPPAQPPSASGRITGKYYMIVQGLGGMTEQHLKQAEKIVKFCKDAGKPVTINRMHNPDQYIIWSLEAFDNPRSAQAVESALSIETLGKKYKEKHGTYNFRQTAPGGRWPWFAPYRQAKPTN